MSFLINPYVFAAAVAYDPDAADYISRVETADGQALEASVKNLINNLFVGVKADGIFGALKASCLMAGARTLAGALTPLLSSMPAPTNVGFNASDYDRKTGLKGDGSTKYLNSNRNNNADPQNNNHNAAYATTLSDTNFLMGATGGACNDAGSNSIGGNGFSRMRSAIGTLPPAPTAAAGFFGINRNSSSSYTVRFNSTNQTVSVASDGLFNASVLIYRRSCSVSPLYTGSRLSYYSIGESLNLALLDARVSTFMSSLAALSL